MLAEQFDNINSNNNSNKRKPISGAKERRTRAYWKTQSEKSRRAQGKVRYDTFRREEQVDEADENLENIHFANFLGAKEVPHLYSYKNANVNVNHCDIETLELPDFDELELDEEELLASSNDKENVYEEDMELVWYYNEITKTLSGVMEPISKIENDAEIDYNIHNAQEETSIAEMVNYMLRQINLANSFLQKHERQEDAKVDEEEPSSKRSRCDDETFNV